MNWIKAEGMGDLWDGEMRGCRIADRPVLVLRQSGRVHAYADACAHLALPMSDGRFENGVLTCTAHEYCYEAASGCGINPKAARLKAYAVKEEGGEVWVDVTSVKP